MSSIKYIKYLLFHHEQFFFTVFYSLIILQVVLFSFQWWVCKDNLRVICSLCTTPPPWELFCISQPRSSWKEGRKWHKIPNIADSTPRPSHFNNHLWAKYNECYHYKINRKENSQNFEDTRKMFDFIIIIKLLHRKGKSKL